MFDFETCHKFISQKVYKNLSPTFNNRRMQKFKDNKNTNEK